MRTYINNKLRVVQTIGSFIVIYLNL
jgi:hypothetical protein